MLLLALLPAALLHCDLEAAGVEWTLLVHHEHGDADDHGHGPADESSTSAVHPSEDFGLQGRESGIKIRSPALWLISDPLALAIASSTAESVAPPTRGSPSATWVRTWHFEQRAAWPARAPDLFA